MIKFQTLRTVNIISQDNSSCQIKNETFFTKLLKTERDSYNLPLVREFIDDFSAIRQLPDKAIEFIAILVKLAPCKRIKTSRRYMARQLGISIRWVSQIATYLSVLGIISKRYKHMDNNVYKLSSIFTFQRVRDSIRHRIPHIDLVRGSRNIFYNITKCAQDLVSRLKFPHKLLYVPVHLKKTCANGPQQSAHQIFDAIFDKIE